MRKHALYVALVAAAFAAMLNITPAQAQATRTWVSGVGDDVNPCSRTAPCKTFAGAISKTADGGEISVLDPGGFGAVTITKSITISGDGTLAGILAAGTNGVIINAAAGKDIILRNISINGTMGATPGIDGIRFLAGGALTLQNVIINGFSSNCVNLALTAAVGVIHIINSNLANCTTGISVSNTAVNQRTSVNVVGGKISDTTTGINGVRQANIALDNVTIAQSSTGVIISSAGVAPASEVNINRGLIAMSGLGVQVNTGATARMNGVYFAANLKALDNQGACQSLANLLGGNVNGNTGAACTPISQF